jgi:hypothetical protein
MNNENVKMSVQPSPALTSGEVVRRRNQTALAVEARKARAYVRQKSEVQVAKQVKKLQLAQAETVARAMVLPAVGLTFIYKKTQYKNEKGKALRQETVRVEDPNEILTALNAINDNGGVVDNDESEHVYYYITTKEPDYRAGEAILNRAIGKVAEKVDTTVNVQFSLRGLARIRQGLPELAPMPVEVRVIDMPKNE